jgi:hypothetical protein
MTCENALRLLTLALLMLALLVPVPKEISAGHRLTGSSTYWAIGA